MYWSKNDIYKELSSNDKPFFLRNIIIGLAAIATAIFTWWKNVLNKESNVLNKESIEIQENTRLDELFAKAIDFLKENNDLITRIGGVHTLKDLAITSPKHAQKCIDMLCSLNESWMPYVLNLQPDFFEVYENKDWLTSANIENLKLKDSPIPENLKSKISLSQSVNKSLSLITIYISKNQTYNDKYDFSHKYLCSISLIETDLTKFNFSYSKLHSANLLYANLQSVYLSHANLQSANLYTANLQSAYLWGANLHSAYLYTANLQSTDLWEANLQSAYLWDANLHSANLIGANLQSAFLKGANLELANLGRANLELANLENTNIESANFIGANIKGTIFKGAKNIDKAKFGDNRKDAIFD